MASEKTPAPMGRAYGRRACRPKRARGGSADTRRRSATLFLVALTAVVVTTWVFPVAGSAAAPRTTITVGSKDRRPISRLLFGLNHRYGFDGYGSFDRAQDRVAPKLVREVRRAGVTWVRYPAGTMANLFHWKRAVGPQRRRGCQVNGGANGDGGPLASDYGPDEHMRFTAEIGGTASIVVNFATGTPREAAQWVKYMNGRRGTSRWADLRVANGHRKPYGVEWWEVANEPWIANQLYWMAGSPAAGTSPSTAEMYAFGGTTRFSDQAVGTNCDRRPAAATSDGRPSQVKFIDYPPIAAGQTIEVAGTPWHEVASLRSVGPKERVYELDRSTGRIRFGDGTHGAIPPAGAEITATYASGPHPGFVRFYRAMKAADPKIHVCASYETDEFIAAMGSAHPYDCIVSHPYLPYVTMDPGGAHDFAMAGADAKAREVAELLRSARDASGHRVRTALTEYGVLPLSPYTGGDLTADSRFLKSLDHALFTASELVHWAQLGISIAARHTLVDFKTTRPGAGVPSPPGFAVFGFAPSFTPSASAWVLDLFAHMTGDRLLRTRIFQDPTRTAATGDYPALLALGSRDHRGRPSLIVVNRDSAADIRTTVSLPRVARRTRLQAWTVDGPSITAFNTVARPHAVRLTKDTQRLRSSQLRWTFPAHSVSALRAVKPRRARPSSKWRP